MKKSSRNWMVGLVCVLMFASFAAAEVFEDFNTVPLSEAKWQYVDPDFSLANGKVTLKQNPERPAYYAYDFMKTQDLFSLDGVSSAAAFEASVDITDTVWNQTDAGQNYFYLRLVPADASSAYTSSQSIAGAIWTFEEPLVSDPSIIAGLGVQIQAGGVSGTQSISTNYNFVVHSIGFRVTDAGVYYLVDGQVLENKFLAFPDGYAIPTDNLKLELRYRGPNQGGAVTVDNLFAGTVPEPATMGFLIAGGVAALLRRKK